MDQKTCKAKRFQKNPNTFHTAKSVKGVVKVKEVRKKHMQQTWFRISTIFILLSAFVILFQLGLKLTAMDVRPVKPKSEWTFDEILLCISKEFTCMVLFLFSAAVLYWTMVHCLFTGAKTSEKLFGSDFWLLSVVMGFLFDSCANFAVMKQQRAENYFSEAVELSFISALVFLMTYILVFMTRDKKQIEITISLPKKASLLNRIKKEESYKNEHSVLEIV